MSIFKFEKVIQRLTAKVKMSATPISGFMLGMSGTDSIITAILLQEVNKRLNQDNHYQPKIQGIHYVDNDEFLDTFDRFGSTWLYETYGMEIKTIMLSSYNHDQYRWADLHYRALKEVDAIGSPSPFWVVSTMNATEKALGTYSILAKSASIAPIASIYKSEVLEICKEFGVPEPLIKLSTIPDCICGREEFAAENIKLIDDVIRHEPTHDYDKEKIISAMDYIRKTKSQNDFKNRTPYNV